MIVFKILLILLVAAPTIGFSLYFYSQMMAFIRERNTREKAEIERERMERIAQKSSVSERKREVKKEKKAAKKRKKDSGRSEEQK